MKKVFALVMCFAFTGIAGAQLIDFDKGIDTTEIVTHYSENSDFSAPIVPGPMGIGRYDRDCVRFSFGPSDEDMLSQKVRLRSMEYIEECHMVPVVDGNGNTTYVRQCHERPGNSWSRNAQISIKARKLFPWEREYFEVCLDGPSLRLYGNATAYDYSANTVGYYDILFELTPEHKIKMNPDEDGIQLVDFKYNKADETYTIKVKDIWAKEYAGEKVMVKIDFYKDGWWFFNSYLGKKEFTFTVAGAYEITFAEKDLKKEVDEGIEDDFKGTEIVKGAKKYYAKWGFSRIGSVSKDKFMKKGETLKITK